MTTDVLGGREAYRKHGERRTYRAGCRCGDCRAANSAYAREHYKRTRR